jgi:hypothetical protein
LIVLRQSSRPAVDILPRLQFENNANCPRGCKCVRCAMIEDTVIIIAFVGLSAAVVLVVAGFFLTNWKIPS